MSNIEEDEKVNDHLVDGDESANSNVDELSPNIEELPARQQGYAILRTMGVKQVQAAAMTVMGKGCRLT